MLTLVLKLVEKFIRAFPIPIKPQNARRILVVDIAYLGDMIMSSFVYRTLKQNFPEARIEALVYPLASGALTPNPFVDRINLIPEKKKIHQIFTALRLRKNKYDITINLFTGLWGNFLIWLIYGKYRIGYNYRYRGCLNNVRIPIQVRTVRSKYRPDECAELLEKAFGWSVTERERIFPVTNESKKTVKLLLESWKISDSDLLIGMQTNCRQDFERRRWDGRKFTELANRIIEKYNAKLVFTGSNDDKEYVQWIKSGIRFPDRLYDALGQSLQDFAALLQRINIFITNNTGPMHLALSQQTPTLAIIGGYLPQIVFPLNNPRYQFVMDKGLENWDPKPKKIKYTPAINNITVDEVFEKFESLLNYLIAEKQIVCSNSFKSTSPHGEK